jgi:hypothetical protein
MYETGINQYLCSASRQVKVGSGSDEFKTSQLWRAKIVIYLESTNTDERKQYSDRQSTIIDGWQPHF